MQAASQDNNLMMSRRSTSMTSQSQAELRRNYKLLKKAFKEEREFRANLETELTNKVQQYNQQAIEMEELKDKNLELYESNMHLQE